MDDGTVLAVQGPNPLATAAGQFAGWGESDPVTVTGTTGMVDNTPVLYVTSIGWAEQTAASGGITAANTAPVAGKTKRAKSARSQPTK
jgi:hypothetical protein